MANTNLGSYLYSSRIRRGFDTTDYLKKYNKITISESYYRDLETGRKIIKIDKAQQLCKSLELDEKEFFYHLLEDLLPKSIFDSLVKTCEDTSFDTPSEEIKKLNNTLSVYRKVYINNVINDVYDADEGILSYFEENFDTLPLLHFICSKNECSFDEIKKLLKKNKIMKSINTILQEFQINKIAIIDFNKKIVKRYKKAFRIPKTEKGELFKDRFLRKEFNRSLDIKDRGDIVAQKNTFLHSSIICLENKPKKINEKLTDLIAQLENDEKSLDEDNTTQFFVSIIFSSREDYKL